MIKGDAATASRLASWTVGVDRLRAERVALTGSSTTVTVGSITLVQQTDRPDQQTWFLRGFTDGGHRDAMDAATSAYVVVVKGDDDRWFVSGVVDAVKGPVTEP